jgi:hypothetical protein
MMSDLESVRHILRTLAEVRDGPFYSLWIDLGYRIKHPSPNIGFRIYRVADSAEAYLVVWVSATRADQVEVCWSVTIQTTHESLIITAGVEITDDNGTHQEYERTAETMDWRQACVLIRGYASEVCAERSWIGGTVGGQS